MSSIGIPDPRVGWIAVPFKPAPGQIVLLFEKPSQLEGLSQDDISALRVFSRFISEQKKSIQYFDYFIRAINMDEALPMWWGPLSKDLHAYLKKNNYESSLFKNLPSNSSSKEFKTFLLTFFANIFITHSVAVERNARNWASIIAEEMNE